MANCMQNFANKTFMDASFLIWAGLGISSAKEPETRQPASSRFRKACSGAASDINLVKCFVNLQAKYKIWEHLPRRPPHK
jgi:hypothetical protein